MPLSPVKEDTDVRVGHDLISVIEDPEDVEARPGKRPSVSDDHAVQPATLEGAVRRLTLEDHVALVPKQNLGFDELRAKWKESEPTFDRLFAYIRKKVLSSRGPYGVADTFTIDMLPDDMERRRAENPEAYREEARKKFIESHRSQFGECEICLKVNDHLSVEYPYLDFYPEGKPVGPNVDLVYIGALKLPGEARRAVLRHCSFCAALGHWCYECPKGKEYGKQHHVDQSHLPSKQPCLIAP